MRLPNGLWILRRNGEINNARDVTKLGSGRFEGALSVLCIALKGADEALLCHVTRLPRDDRQVIWG